jgi:flagella basal body P-ring formation protein FlgA
MNLKTTFSRHFKHALLGVLAAAWLLAWSAPGMADEFTAPEQLIGATQGFLEFTVEDYLATSQIEGRYEIQVAQLDPRLRMAACDRPLTTTQQSPGVPLGRVTVKVRCEGAAPWTVFVGASVKLLRPVVVTVRPMKRDSVLAEGDLALREQDVGLLSQGYLTELDQALGQKLVRPTVNGQVLTPVHLEQVAVVVKGDHVVITARAGTLAVRMPGEALSDGGMSEQIRVRNLNSQRVVKARVMGPGQVEVSM